MLTANGSIFTPGVSVLPNGAGTLSISGGNLTADSSSATVITAGKPSVSPLVAGWAVYPLQGTFSPSIKTPVHPRGAGGRGIYLPKSNSAWGYFPGITLGGRIELK